MQRFKQAQLESSFRRFVPLGFALSSVFFFGYLIEQQHLRLEANDQLVQIANDITLALAQGAPYSTFTSPRPVDMSRSLSPYAIIFDGEQKMQTGSGVLDGVVPRPPKGVFEYVKLHREERVTWEPRRGVRVALVGVYHDGVNSGFVFAGRSLSEVERKIDELTKLTAFVWATSLLSTFVLSVLFA